MENKQEILNLLLPALQATRNLDDLATLIYIKEKGVVEARFSNGGKKLANIEGDSGTSMIRDVIKQII